MKKSFTLIEILVSVSIIIVVIGGYYQITSNSLNFLNIFEKHKQQNAIIALAITNKEDKKIFLDDIIDLKDDEIRKKLKNIRLKQKVREIDSIDLDVVKLGIEEIDIKYNNSKKIFYSFNIKSIK